MKDLSDWTTFPFELPVRLRALAPPVVEEPPRAGKAGSTAGLAPLRTLAVAELPPTEAAEFGPLVGRVQRAVESIGGIGRVHLNYWGDGSAHFHIWFHPRPYGHLQLRGTMLGMWSAGLDDLPDDEVRTAGQTVAANLSAPG
jgi:hypothetical protein